LGGCRAAYLEILGVKMTVSAQGLPVKPTCPSHDKLKANKKGAVTSVPASWKLTAQQQAFIDSFADSDDKKR